MISSRINQNRYSLQRLISTPAREYESGAKDWNDVANQQKFMDWVSKQLNITEMSDWYKILRKVRNYNLSHLINSQQDFVKIGANSILTNFDNSPFHCLSSVYPDYNWLPWKFTQVPKNYWENVNNQKKFIDWAATQLNIKEMSDWYKVTRKVSHICGTSSVTNKGLLCSRRSYFAS
jgi:hypothetical protein